MAADREQSPIVTAHLPCPECGSSDAASLRADGSGFCFANSCQLPPGWMDDDQLGQYKMADSTRPPKTASDPELLTLIREAEPYALSKRRITQASVRHWSYHSHLRGDGTWEQVAQYHDEAGRLCAAKVRNIGADGDQKKFHWLGEKSKAVLYGRNLWGEGGKIVVVTEGELDAISLSQCQGHKWPVVSTIDGAASAKNDIARNLQWLNTFERVIIMFDQDEPGQEAALDCARMLPPGKAYIAHLPEKDANEMLVKGRTEELTRAVHSAKLFRPDGIVCADDLIADVLNPPVSGIPWPWRFMTGWTYGRRYGETYSFGAGTGVGKSDAINQIIAFTIGPDVHEACAVFNWESGPAKTFKAILGKQAKRRFHIPNVATDEEMEVADWTDEELRAATRYYKDECAKLYMNDHFGAVDWPAVKERIRFLARAEGVKHFVLDPITALTAQEADERKALDQIMAEIAALGQELEACMYVVSHLTKPEGTPHEEGGRVQLKNFRGSNAIVMWSFYVFGYERNQQADDPREAGKTLLRCLKDRFTGNATGKTKPLYYDIIHGTLDVETFEDI